MIFNMSTKNSNTTVSVEIIGDSWKKPPHEPHSIFLQSLARWKTWAQTIIYGVILNVSLVAGLSNKKNISLNQLSHLRNHRRSKRWGFCYLLYNLHSRIQTFGRHSWNLSQCSYFILSKSAFSFSYSLNITTTRARGTTRNLCSRSEYFSCISFKTRLVSAIIRKLL